MERNPHWDETITEDIGSKGPHFNPPLGVTVPMWSPQQEWGDVGGGGEFTGWRSQEDPPSYRSDWQDYPADEFIGIQSNVPSGGSWFKKLFDMYGGTMPGLGTEIRKFDTPYRLTPEEKFIQKQQRDLQKENMRDYYYNQYKPGPWNEFDPPSPLPYPSFEQDWVMAELSGQQGDWMDSPIGSPDFYGNFDDYFDAVTMQEDQGSILPWWLGGSSAQEPATKQEVLDKLNEMMQEKNQRLPWPVV